MNKEAQRKIAKGFISDDVMDSLSWLTEYGRTPTWLELDRFIKELGYCKLLPLLSDNPYANEPYPPIFANLSIHQERAAAFEAGKQAQREYEGKYD